MNRTDIQPGCTAVPQRRRYGPDPATTPTICDFSARIGELVETCSADALPGEVADGLARLLGTTGLLDRAHMVPDTDDYRRHLLFADPLRRFTVLALVWLPGQATPVHGHTCWGAVGIYEGELTITRYRFRTGLPLLHCDQESVVRARPGMTDAVRPGLADVHRVANQSTNPAISIHVYGRDLVQDPASLNIVLSH